MGYQCLLKVQYLLTGALITLRIVGPGYEIFRLRSNADTDVNLTSNSVIVYVNCNRSILAELNGALSLS
jgi:hypothetical protein